MKAGANPSLQSVCARVVLLCLDTWCTCYATCVLLFSADCRQARALGCHQQAGRAGWPHSRTAQSLPAFSAVFCCARLSELFTQPSLLGARSPSVIPSSHHTQYSCMCSFVAVLQIAAKLGHLDVINKLVELGADWPHGRAAAIVGNDVVQLLIENYKGPKKLQV